MAMARVVLRFRWKVGFNLPEFWLEREPDVGSYTHAWLEQNAQADGLPYPGIYQGHPDLDFYHVPEWPGLHDADTTLWPSGRTDDEVRAAVRARGITDDDVHEAEGRGAPEPTQSREDAILGRRLTPTSVPGVFEDELVFASDLTEDDSPEARHRRKYQRITKPDSRLRDVWGRSDTSAHFGCAHAPASDIKGWF